MPPDRSPRRPPSLDPPVRTPSLVRRRADPLATRAVAAAAGIATTLGLVTVLVPAEPAGNGTGVAGSPVGDTLAMTFGAGDVTETPAPSPVPSASPGASQNHRRSPKPKATAKARARASTPVGARSTPKPAGTPKPRATAKPTPKPTPKATPKPTPKPTPVPTAPSGKP